jgi:hypothetical protein
LKKYQHFASKVGTQGEIRIPVVHRDAICKDLGIEELKGCILELNITVIHLKDNTTIKLL